MRVPANLRSLCFAVLLAATASANEITPQFLYTGPRFDGNSCVECHSNTGTNGSVVLRFNNQAITTYTPGGAQMAVAIIITDNQSPTPQRWGFQLTARFANGAQAGTFSAAGGNTAVLTFTSLQNTQVRAASHNNAARSPGTTFTYNVNWTPPADASGGTIFFNVAANAANGDRTFNGDRIYTAEVQATPAGGGPAPSVPSAGIVSAASFQAAPNNQVARGQLISIFGTNLLASGERADATSLPLPRSLAGTSVQVNGSDIPLINVFPGQINAQLPVELSDTGNASLTVTVQGQTSSPAAAVTLAQTAPGIFTVAASGVGNGAILNVASQLVDSSRPARAGDIVVIFCTGLGLTNPAAVTGQGAPGAAPAVAAVTVTIGGRAASVQYAGLAPGFVGLYQINVVVPSNLTAGNQEVLIQAAATTSRAGVTIPVQ
jgi:uncharacterized protein (TIGR03437 family)